MGPSLIHTSYILSSRLGKRVRHETRRVDFARTRLGATLTLTTTMATAGDVQRLFLQAVISRCVVPIKLAKILWQKSIEAVNGSFFSPRLHRGSKG